MKLIQIYFYKTQILSNQANMLIFLSFAVIFLALVGACIWNKFNKRKKHKKLKKEETERIKRKLHEMNAKYLQLKNNNQNMNYRYSTYIRYEKIQHFEIKYFMSSDVRKDLLRTYYIARIGNISLKNLYFLSRKSERANYFKQICHYNSRLLNISNLLTKESNPAFLYSDYTYSPNFLDRCVILYNTLRLLSLRETIELFLNGFDSTFIIWKINANNNKFTNRIKNIKICGPMLLYKRERSEWIMLYFHLALGCPWPILDSLINSQ
jgi:hypothetical protein